MILSATHNCWFMPASLQLVYIFQYLTGLLWLHKEMSVKDSITWRTEAPRSRQTCRSRARLGFWVLSRRQNVNQYKKYPLYRGNQQARKDVLCVSWAAWRRYLFLVLKEWGTCGCLQQFTVEKNHFLHPPCTCFTITVSLKTIGSTWISFFVDWSLSMSASREPEPKLLKLMRDFLKISASVWLVLAGIKWLHLMQGEKRSSLMWHFCFSLTEE